MTDADVAYDGLAGVYDWLVPEPLLTPDGTVAACAALVESLPPGGRVASLESASEAAGFGVVRWVAATYAATHRISRPAQSTNDRR